MTLEYPFEIRPLTAIEGGGYLIRFPDSVSKVQLFASIVAVLNSSAQARV